MMNLPIHFCRECWTLAKREHRGYEKEMEFVCTNGR